MGNKSAKHNYKEIYEKIWNMFKNNDPTNGSYIEKMCQLYINSNGEYNERDIRNLFIRYDKVRQSIPIPLQDFRKMTYEQLMALTERYEKESNMTPIYDDEYFTIYAPKTFEQSRKLGTHRWCSSYSLNRWQEQTQGDNATLYIIYNHWGNRMNHDELICVKVYSTGLREYYLSHNECVNRYENEEVNGVIIPSVHQIEKMLGENVLSLLTHKNTLNCNRTNQRDKKVIRITEVDLVNMIHSQIIKEWKSLIM